MIPTEWQELVRTCRDLPATIECALSANGRDTLSEDLLIFTNLLAGGAKGKILVTQAHTSHNALTFPCLSLGAAGSFNIHYYAPPRGHGIECFQDILIGLAERMSQGSKTSGRLADQVRGEIQLFVSPSCTHCPNVVRHVASLAIAHPLVDLHIVEAERNEERARDYGIRSVPATVINREIVEIGLVPKERIISLLTTRGSIFYIQEHIRTLINSGKADHAADIVIAHQDPRILVPLLQRVPFSERIGLLVAMEEALHRDPRCLDSIVDDLVSLLSLENRQLKGDIAYMLGKISHVAARAALERLLDDGDPEVVEIAREALEEHITVPPCDV